MSARIEEIRFHNKARDEKGALRHLDFTLMYLNENRHRVGRRSCLDIAVMPRFAKLYKFRKTQRDGK